MTEFKIDLTEAQARRLIDYLSATSGVVDKRIAQSLEAQLPVREPRAFGSVVRASVADAVGRRLLVRTLEDARPVKEWCLGIERYEWSDLRNPEVVRVGLGDPS